MFIGRASLPSVVKTWAPWAPSAQARAEVVRFDHALDLLGRSCPTQSGSRSSRSLDVLGDRQSPAAAEALPGGDECSGT